MGANAQSTTGRTGRCGWHARLSPVLAAVPTDSPAPPNPAERGRPYVATRRTPYAEDESMSATTYLCARYQCCRTRSDGSPGAGGHEETPTHVGGAIRSGRRHSQARWRAAAGVDDAVPRSSRSNLLDTGVHEHDTRCLTIPDTWRYPIPGDGRCLTIPDA